MESYLDSVDHPGAFPCQRPVWDAQGLTYTSRHATVQVTCRPAPGRRWVVEALVDLRDGAGLVPAQSVSASIAEADIGIYQRAAVLGLAGAARALRVGPLGPESAFPAQS